MNAPGPSRHASSIDGGKGPGRSETKAALQEQLHAATRYAHALLDASMDPLLVIDMQQQITDANRAAEEITGLSRDQLIGTNLRDRFLQGEALLDMVLQAFRDGQVRSQALTIQHATGRKTEVLCSVTTYCDAYGKVIGAFLAARDVTDLRKYETQMSFQATCDALTALPNRLVFRESLVHALQRAESRSGSVGLMFIDLDNFKDINDTLGHAVGDKLLKETATRLAEALRPTEMVARMGGDEFAVLIEDAEEIRDRDNLASKLRDLIAQSHVIDGHEVTVSCSVGITLYPLDGTDVDTLLRNADAALYRAKEDGKNTCRHFIPEINDAICRRVDISNCLRRALKFREFTLHFQPRAELAGGRITGVEALIRWNSPDLGAVSPAEFIPVAESNGLIVPIGEWVLQQACRQAVQWQTVTQSPVSVAVNLSARQFREVDAARMIMSALEETGLAADLLEIELTESTLMHDARHVARTLDSLKDIGVRLAVDDFGTGYSSLSYLKSFPLDYLKIDRSFIKDVSRSLNDKAIVRAIIAMAHTLGIKVIAEGVEATDQLAFLLEQGCDELQGYYFSKPLPMEGLTTLLGNNCRLELANVSVMPVRRYDNESTCDTSIP